MKVGLFFGSFNPVHTGHLIIAQHIANQPEVDQVWLVVSPHNPFKSKQSLANDYDRLHLVNLALEDNPALKSCSIEFNLPQPNYTIDTLTYLREKYPSHEFALIVGSDILPTLDKWKNHELLIRDYTFYVYGRPGNLNTTLYRDHASFIFCEGPLIEISASYIRECIQQGKSIRYLVPDKVFDYLDGSNLYGAKWKK